MEKKLIKVGNSVALVIDKSFRDELGIVPTTVVRVVCDGERLIVQKSGDRADDKRRAAKMSEEVRARAIANALIRTYQMSNAALDRLTAAWKRGIHRPLLYLGWIESTSWDAVSDAERRVVRRFEAAYLALRAQRGWEDAIAAALQAEPFDPNDPGEQSVGCGGCFSAAATLPVAPGPGRTS